MGKHIFLTISAVNSHIFPSQKNKPDGSHTESQADRHQNRVGQLFRQVRADGAAGLRRMRTPYRCCTWTAKGDRKIVWRCINQLNYGKKYCHHSPNLEESAVQRAIMEAISTTARQNADVLQTLKLHIGMGLHLCHDEVYAALDVLQNHPLAYDDYLVDPLARDRRVEVLDQGRLSGVAWRWSRRWKTADDSQRKGHGVIARGIRICVGQFCTICCRE